MMRTVFRRFSALALTILVLTQCALAAFSSIRESVEFSDVSYSHWAHYYIDTMYRCGLMQGTGEGQFSPSGTVSVAQAIMVSVRVWDIYRGGDGVIDQSEGRWYDGAVSKAISIGLITGDQFDDYTRSATRAELVHLLARVLPAEEYEAINDIKKIPDVDETTPYAQEIYLLYNAGILTGSDGYGTFYPQRDITRAELCAILYRMIYDWERQEFTLLEPPADLTVYSSSKCLLLDGFPVYGLTRINGEYYLPLALLDLDTTAPAYFMDYYRSDENTVRISFRSSTHESNRIAIVDYAAIPPEGKVMGQADPDPDAVELRYGESIHGAIYTMGGRYPMVSLSVLGAKAEGDKLVLNVCEEEKYTIVYEQDLLGAAYWQIVRDNDRDTAIAIHDYLVNHLTYDILTSAPSGTTQEEFEAAAARWEEAHAAYSLWSNVLLSSGYAICQDYAELFQALCVLVGIPCDVVTGSAGGPHAWNKVYVDGEWLYMDCTWDDPVSRQPQLRHDYCLVGPDRMVRSHYWDGEDYPMPEEYDPAWEQLDPYNITDPDMFRKCLIAQLVIANRENPYGEKTVKLRVTKSGAYGGTGCLYAGYEGAYWWYYTGGYDSASGMYIYRFG